MQHPKQQPQPQPQQPQQLPSTKDYMVGPIIGEGTFGQVFYGQHKSTQREVAIKVIEKITCEKYPHIIHCIQTERNLLTRNEELQSSPYIVNLWASFIDTQCIYLVMELSNGGDLQNFIEYAHSSGTSSTSTSPSSIQLRKEAWKESIPYYSLQIIDAVQFIHSKHIIHSDMKPQNILCHSNGKLCLTDFACAFELLEDESSSSSLSLSSSGSNNNNNNNVSIPRGTPQYACPEIIRSHPTTTSSASSSSKTPSLTAAVDLWSLGCILYCMHVGKSPFERQSEALTIKAIMDYCAADGDDIKKTTNNRFCCFSSSLDDGYSSSCMDEWEKDFICGLIHSSPDERIKCFKDARTKTKTISDDDKNNDDNSRKILFLPNMKNNIPTKKPLLLPPKPPWEEQLAETKLKDGALGWGVFML